jgi:hypothetical protein
MIPFVSFRPISAVRSQKVVDPTVPIIPRVRHGLSAILKLRSNDGSSRSDQKNIVRVPTNQTVGDHVGTFSSSLHRFRTPISGVKVSNSQVKSVQMIDSKDTHTRAGLKRL